MKRFVSSNVLFRNTCWEIIKSSTPTFPPRKTYINRARAFAARSVIHTARPFARHLSIRDRARPRPFSVRLAKVPQEILFIRSRRRVAAGLGITETYELGFRLIAAARARIRYDRRHRRYTDINRARSIHRRFTLARLVHLLAYATHVSSSPEDKCATRSGAK